MADRRLLNSPNPAQRLPHKSRPRAAEADPIPQEPGGTPDEATEPVADDGADGLSKAESRLYDEFRATVDKLERDRATLGDLKLLTRTFKELRYAFSVFKPLREARKVTVFGSARTPPDDPDFQSAVEFGRLMAGEEWLVVTGAGNGIMEAAHVGSGRDHAVGLNIMLPFEQAANPIVDGSDWLVNLRYFFTRKLLFIKEVHAVVCYPGGFGTQDEAFETLTLVQTGKRDMMPIVLVEREGGDYWSAWEEFVSQRLLRDGLISPSDRSLYTITQDPAAAVDEILRFYCVYNSMRYVKGQLVLRLHKEPTDEFMDVLNDRFGGLLASGRIEKCETHRFEADDEQTAHLPRIRMHYNRRDAGILREMIDFINAELSPSDCAFAVREVE